MSHGKYTIVSLCRNAFTLHKLSRCATITPKMRVLQYNKSEIKCYSTNTKTGDQWKDGSVVYSTSKASSHHVNKTFGYNENSDKNAKKSLILGCSVFAIIVYFGYIHKGEKNDILDIDMSQFLKPVEKNSGGENEGESKELS